MASQLGGLFAQLNNAILQHPLNESFDFSVPGEPERLMDSVNPMLRTAVQGVAGAAGMPSGATETSQQAVRARQQKARESLAKKAEKIGLPALAEEIRSGEGDLAEQAKVMHKHELELVAKQANWPAQRSALIAMGVPREEVDAYRNADQEAIDSLMDGKKGKTKGFTASDGRQVVLREGPGGRVWDKDANGGVGGWRDPSEMGLAPSVNTQRILDAGQAFAKEIAKHNAENVIAFHGEARDAQAMLTNLEQVTPLVDDMIAGRIANWELWARQMAAAFGADPSEVANTEAFMAMAGTRVANVIKAFGSGTGLSDADREYAKQIAAGEITVTPEALKKLLGIHKKGATKLLNDWQDIESNTRSALGADANLMDTLAPVSTPAQIAEDYAPPASVGRGPSERSKKYFGG